MSSYISYDITSDADTTMYLTVNFTNWHVNEDLALSVSNAAQQSELTSNTELTSDTELSSNTQSTCDPSFWEKGYDYKNGQHNNANATSPADCCAKCAVYTGFGKGKKCTAWTFAYPTCWLKTSTGGRRKEGGNITSGGVAPPTPVPPTPPPTPRPPTPKPAPTPAP
jgi:hypothetical protein